MFTLRTSPCPDCRGLGRVRETVEDRGAIEAYYTDCPTCAGLGTTPRPVAADGPTDGSHHSARRTASHLLHHWGAGGGR